MALAQVAPLPAVAPPPWVVAKLDLGDLGAGSKGKMAQLAQPNTSDDHRFRAIRFLLTAPVRA